MADAILDPNVILDDLSSVIDEVRGDLHGELGNRPYRVFTVLRTWDGGRPGVGQDTEVETELTPQPWVQPYVGAPGLSYKLEPCGLDEAGFVKVKEVSLKYSQSELTGRAVAAEVEGDAPEGTEFFLRVREAHGQLQSFKDFRLSGSPWPDREKNIGWELDLIKVEES